MPGIDWKEATRRLRADFRFKDLSVFAVTAHAVEAEAADILNSGVDRLITKPISEVGLLEAIAERIGANS